MVFSISSALNIRVLFLFVDVIFKVAFETPDGKIRQYLQYFFCSFFEQKFVNDCYREDPEFSSSKMLRPKESTVYVHSSERDL